jgi:hypothetical protein
MSGSILAMGFGVQEQQVYWRSSVSLRQLLMVVIGN